MSSLTPIRKIPLYCTLLEITWCLFHGEVIPACRNGPKAFFDSDVHREQSSWAFTTLSQSSHQHNHRGITVDHDIPTRSLCTFVLPSLAAFIYFHKHIFLYFIFERGYFFFLLTSKSLFIYCGYQSLSGTQFANLFSHFVCCLHICFNLFMKDNHFTILCWPLSYINMNQPLSPTSWTSLPPPTPSHPSKLSQNTAFELPVLYSNFPPAI